MKFNKNEFGWKEKVSVNTDELVTKEYVDDKTEILPIANKYIVFKDAVPHFQEEVYIFDNLQNEEMISGSVDGELTISFNDGTEDMLLEYSKEKIADSVIRHYKKQTFVASVKKEEF